MAGSDLVLTSLTKRFGSFVAVDRLDLTVPQGSFFALLGPSGCGKTTTLRMVAGFEAPTDGSIRLGGTDITLLRPYRRPVNTVFQSYALFPHLSVFENVAFGLRRRGVAKVEPQVREMLDLVQLGPHADHRPAQLSGGQQQRVALARALINRPQVLLLDEPLGALDLKLRRQMQIELKRIQTEVGITFVHVTHDQEEAMTMADTVAVMNGGVIEQMGPPAELYEHPRTTFVSNFLGQANLVAGRVVERTGGTIVLDVQGARVRVPASRAPSERQDLWVGVRPEKVVLAPAGTAGAPGDDATAGRSAGPGADPAAGPTAHEVSNVLPGGVIVDVSFSGVSTQYLARMPWGQELMVFEQNTGARAPLRTGDRVSLRWMPAHTFLLDAAQDASAGALVEDAE